MQYSFSLLFLAFVSKIQILNLFHDLRDITNWTNQLQRCSYSCYNEERNIINGKKFLCPSFPLTETSLSVLSCRLKNLIKEKTTFDACLFLIIIMPFLESVVLFSLYLQKHHPRICKLSVLPSFKSLSSVALVVVNWWMINNLIVCVGETSFDW